MENIFSQIGWAVLFLLIFCFLIPFWINLMIGMIHSTWFDSAREHYEKQFYMLKRLNEEMNNEEMKHIEADMNKPEREKNNEEEKK